MRDQVYVGMKIHRWSWGSEMTILEAASGLYSEVESPNSTLEYSLFQNFMKRWKAAWWNCSHFEAKAANDLQNPCYLQRVGDKIIGGEVNSPAMGKRRKEWLIVRTWHCPLSEKTDNTTGTISFPHSTNLIEFFPYARDHVSHWEQDTILVLKELA